MSATETAVIWHRCLRRLSERLPEKEFNTWILPLQVQEDENQIALLAPNRMVLDRISGNYQDLIREIIEDYAPISPPKLLLAIGSSRIEVMETAASHSVSEPVVAPSIDSRLDPKYSFESFVQGKSNQIARAAAEQVADNPGQSYNPLLIYGGSGLGKTHLMHAIGHRILADRPSARIVYRQAERFVNEYVAAIRHSNVDDFKSLYRNADALLIDDIQFFAGKKGTQEEFFHTFDALLQDKRQIVLTCDRLPKELDKLDERLKTRFTWGLPVSVEPPDMETRTAILMRKAELAGINLPQEVAFFIAKAVRSNVRELESALHRLDATSRLTGQQIDLDFARQVLHDILASNDRLITIESIQTTVADYFQIRKAELLSKRRNRSVARPRQIAMAISKELTDRSLPEIGEAFGGRDHTTVLHACRKVAELCRTDTRINEDYNNLLRILSH